MSGRYDPWFERRIVAAATRSALALLTSYSAIGFLLLQVVALALATTIAVRSVTRWRGPWAGLAFFGLIYLLLRPYLSTFLTEPLGLLLSLAVPYVVRALRQGPWRLPLSGLDLRLQLTRSGPGHVPTLVWEEARSWYEPAGSALVLVGWSEPSWLCAWTAALTWGAGLSRSRAVG
jgi:hypothetical protein